MKAGEERQREGRELPGVLIYYRFINMTHWHPRNFFFWGLILILTPLLTYLRTARSPHIIGGECPIAIAIWHERMTALLPGGLAAADLYPSQFSSVTVLN